ICFHGEMQVDARKGSAERSDLGIDQAEIVDEQRRVARLGDQGVGAPAADYQHGLTVGFISGRNRPHWLGHDVNSSLRATRSSLPFGLRGNASRQTMAVGCMKLGSWRLRKARRLSSSSRRSG